MGYPDQQKSWLVPLNSHAQFFTLQTQIFKSCLRPWLKVYQGDWFIGKTLLAAIPFNV